MKSTLTSMGKKRRLSRLFDKKSGRSLLVPVDDSLIFGPFGGLRNLPNLLNGISSANPNGVLCFLGAAKLLAEEYEEMAVVLNLTASTIRSSHTRKALVATVDMASAMDAAAVAVHVNITDEYEREMLITFGQIVREAESSGIPVLAIMYPRRTTNGIDYNYEKERDENPEFYASLVSHACRVALEIGADAVKSPYVPNHDLLMETVAAAHPAPLFIAGGPLKPAKDSLKMAADALSAGVKGISFGRNVFGRQNPAEMILALRALVHEGGTIKEAQAFYKGTD